MTSVLAQQLQALGKSGVSLPRGKGRPSLLFEAHQAADIDLQTIYEIALQGLVELCQADDSLKPFLSTLFRRDRVGLEREHQNKAINEKMDQSVTGFLTLLSRHFLKDAATKVLEFLIRQYRVNETNVSALMSCALPYHSTLQFVRLVQTMRLDGLWTFLAPMQQSGAPLPRSTLVQRCSNDAALLQFVCQAAQQAASPAWLSFYGVVVCEVIAAVPKVTEDAIAQLLPFVLEGLKGSSPKEQRMATYMIVMQLIAKSTPAPQLFNVLCVEVAKGAREGPTGPCLLVLTGLLKSQAGHASLPPKTLKHIMRLPHLLDELSAKHKQMGPLLQRLLSSLLGNRDNADACHKLIQDLIARVPIAEHAEAAASQLLRALQTATQEELPGMQQTMRALDVRYPSQVDAAVNKALEPLAKNKKGDAAKGSGGDEESVEKAKKVLEFVTGALDKRSARMPLPDASTTLAHAIDAPSAELRRTAVMQLGESADAENGEGDDWVMEVLLRRLADDDAGVVNAVLDSPLLMSIPAAALFDGLSSALHRATALLRSAGGDKAGARGIARKVLKLLAGPFLRQHAVYQQRIIVLLLDHVIMLPAQRKLSMAALKALKKQDVPELSGLHNVDAELLEKSPMKPADAASDNSHADYDHNRKIIAAIAHGLQGHRDAEGVVALATAGHEAAQHVLLLALCHACLEAAEKGSSAAGVILRILLKDPGTLSSNAAAESPDIPAHLADDGLPSEEHFSSLAANPQDTHRALQRHSLLVALQHASPAVLEQWAQGPHALFHLIASLSPAQAYEAHLCALVDTVAKQFSPAAFLSDVFGHQRADGTEACDIQVRALDLLRSRYSVPRKAHKAADATAVFHTVLPRLLAAISSPRRPVRAAALAALPVAVANIYGSHAKGTLTQPHLAELVAAITQHQDMFEADAGALAASLRHALQHAQHAGPASASKGAKRGKASKAGAFDKRSFFSLSNAAATAVADYFLAILPEQHGECGAAAALLLLHSVDTSANASAALRVGSLLLSRYVAHKVDASEQQLMRELLGLYTPDALAGLAEQLEAAKLSHNPVDIFLSILARQPSDAEAERSVTSMRHLALSRLSAALYAAIPADRQLQLLLAVLHASSSDPDEACRAAAHRALADAPVSAAALQKILSLDPSPPAITPAKKTRAAKPAENGGQASASLENCIAALELLQWKANVVDGAELVGTLCSLLPHLLAISNEAAPATANDTSEDIPSRSVAAGYGLQLALTALQLVVTRHAQEGAADSVDLQAVLECARQAPNSMACSAALTLLAQLASVLPRSTLEHVVEVVTAQASTSGQDADAVSVEASARVLRAFASAWVAAGHAESELIHLVVKASEGVPARSRLPLLTALSAPLPSVIALQSICIALLELAVQSLKGDEGNEDFWLSTAADVVGKVAWETRAQAFQGVLEECVQEAKSADLQAAALRFIADQVATLMGSSSDALDAPVQQALTSLMQSATNKLQQASEGEVEGALTALLGALEHAMPAADYLKGLVILTQHDNQALRRRALRLFTSKMDSLQAGQQEHQEGAAAAEAASLAAAEAGAAVAEQLPRLLAADQNAGVRQAALLALSSVARAVGREHPDLVLAALPSALAATKDAQRPVRSSALATVAACAAALGTRSLPQLVPLVTAVLSAVETAGNALTAAEGGQPEQAEAHDADEERRRSGAAAEALHVEAASALAALDALAAGMGAFLAPYLPRVLALVLQRSILACRAPQVAATASHAWRVLAGAIPPRLLLPPLFAQLNPALQGGAVPARALLQMVERAVAAMQPATAAAHADALFGFLQQALDVRQRGGCPAADADVVERAATATLVAATMKLSEKQFKPLFLRLLAWASTPPAGHPDVQPLGRQAVLYGVIYALTERLRSVFVPYFRYVMDGAIALLAGQAGDASQPKKKRKKSKALEPVSDVAAADACTALNTWLLRFRVLQSVRACFQYDSVQFVDEDLFRRLLPALVTQLAAFHPPDVLPLLAANEDASLAPAGGADGAAMWRAQDSAYGRAVVTALVELAVSCGSDTLWKPFNDEVWKRAMQSEVPMERSRALAVIHAFVDRVREDWSFLIGESVMPFSEIAEVTDPLLQAQTKQLRDLILDITGEDMYELSKIS